MNDLQVVGFSQRMSSREIAELTEKRHDNVLRDIKNLIEQGAIGLLNFEESNYTNLQGKSQPQYLLDFDAAMTLLIRYGTTYDAAKEILSKHGLKEKAMENLPMNRSNFGRTMSSREIAELTEKRHDHVLRDIKTLINQGAITAPNFGVSAYTDASGKSNPEYLLNLKATMTLITGYNAVLRAKVIDRWYELEEGGAKPSGFPSLTQKELEARDLKAEMESLKAKKEIFKTLHEFAEFFGLEGNQALLAADKGFRKLHNTSPLALLGVELKSPDNEALIIATEIGKRLDPPKSPNFVNRTLKDMGFLERVEYKANKFDWRLTEKGKEYGTYLDVGKEHSDGTPVQQIKWKESVVPLLSSYLDELSLP